MFTVKVIEPNGRERGISIEKWTFLPATKDVLFDAQSKTSVNTETPASIYLFLDKDSVHVEEIQEGDIYIMNESGRTVADYHLGEFED